MSEKNRKMFQRSIIATLLVAVPAAFAGTDDQSESVESPIDHYRVLQWQDLVPEGWEPPVVAEAYDSSSAAEVDEAATVAELDQQLAALPGYIKPVVFEGNKVFEFILVPFLPHQIKAHAHLDSNQMVYVYVHDSFVVDKPFEPVWVIGAMSLEPVMTDEGPAAYRMTEAITTEYTY